MFAVIADDLSGAAEIAGIALDYGLSSEITSENTIQTNSDLLVFNTASRHLKPKQAWQRVNQTTEFLTHLKPDWIYKKTDSVLRGNVLAEMDAIQNVMGINKALLLPANPGLGRTIIKRNYFINGQDIHKTSFANDPQYPIKSADVMEILGKRNKMITGYLNKNQSMPDSGVFVGEVADRDCLFNWAGKVERQTLTAGAAEFFRTLLEKKNFKKVENDEPSLNDLNKILFVCGSNHINSRKAIQEAFLDGASICYLPEILLEKTDNKILKTWLKKIELGFQSTQKVILAVEPSSLKSKNISRRIEKIFSKIVRLVISHIDLNTLAIEGGETAQSICIGLSINHLYPAALMANGVVSLATKIQKPATIIIKPGSYMWPNKLWSFN